MITTADLFIMRMWKAQEECAVQACVVGIEVHVRVKAGSFSEGCTEPNLRRNKKSQMQEIFEHTTEIIGSPSEIHSEQHVV